MSWLIGAALVVFVLAVLAGIFLWLAQWTYRAGYDDAKEGRPPAWRKGEDDDG